MRVKNWLKSVILGVKALHCPTYDILEESIPLRPSTISGIVVKLPRRFATKQLSIHWYTSGGCTGSTSGRTIAVNYQYVQHQYRVHALAYLDPAHSSLEQRLVDCTA